MIKKTGLSVTVISFLTACGGGAGVAALANLGFIAPIGGDFTLDEDPSTLGLDISSGNEKSINIQIQTEPQTDEQWDNYFFESFEITGSNSDLLIGEECLNFNGTVRGFEVSAVSASDPEILCFEGNFENEIVLRLSDGSRLMRREFFVDLTTGTWVNINDESQRFVFDSSSNLFSGCEITANDTSIVTGELVDTDLNQGTVAFISELLVQRASGTQAYTGKLRGNSGLVLTSGDEEIRLERRDQESNCNT